MPRELRAQDELAIPIQMHTQIGDASCKGQPRHIRHEHLETSGDLYVANQVGPLTERLDHPLHPGLLALTCACLALPAQSPHAQQLASQFRIDDQAFLLGQRFLQTWHAITGMLFDEPTQHRTQCLVFLASSLLRFLTVVIGFLADPQELTDLVHARCSLCYQRSRVTPQVASSRGVKIQVLF